MHEHDLNRVEFYSKEDMAGGYQLKKGEPILRNKTNSNYTDINDILELYSIKKYLDHDLFLTSWTEGDILEFKEKAVEYGKITGKFLSDVNDSNFINLYEKTLRGYIGTFWELVSNQNLYKRISKDNFDTILSKEPHIIHVVLTYKALVDYYSSEIRKFLLTYSQAAEILLSIFEVKDDYNHKQKYIPKSLSIQDKENIISTYLDSVDVNFNYIKLIQNARNKADFKISDKTRLKAKRLHENETEKFFEETSGTRYGVSVSFPENAPKIKDGFIDEEHIAHYSYSLDFIKKNNTPQLLFQNFKLLFEYLDNQNRISLVSRKSQISVLERVMGVHSQNEYRGGTSFSFLEMTSYVQIIAYNRIVIELNHSLEDILKNVFTLVFHEKYNFASNARFLVPTATNSYFEKVRLIAPEFESVLKQYGLFVEEGKIDFELLQISSSPSAITNIPSLNQKKYIYFNEENDVMVGCSNLFFSDQTLLAHVEPFKEKNYHNFFDLLANEQVKYGNYEEHQKPQLDHLVSKGFLVIGSNDFIEIANRERLVILKDLSDNEVASFHLYSLKFRHEAEQMVNENIIYFETSLFSKPEQAYFNYYLNKSEYTNGLDLRNSYLHGTQANPEETQRHEHAYFTYIKLIFLAMLKIEDDLSISNLVRSRE